MARIDGNTGRQRSKLNAIAPKPRRFKGPAGHALAVDGVVPRRNSFWIKWHLLDPVRHQALLIVDHARVRELKARLAIPKISALARRHDRAELGGLKCLATSLPKLVEDPGAGFNSYETVARDRAVRAQD